MLFLQARAVQLPPALNSYGTAVTRTGLGETGFPGCDCSHRLVGTLRFGSRGTYTAAQARVGVLDDSIKVSRTRTNTNYPSKDLRHCCHQICKMSSPFPLPAPPQSPLARYRLLSPTASVRVSPLCLGAMNFGDAWKDFRMSSPALSSLRERIDAVSW